MSSSALLCQLDSPQIAWAGMQQWSLSSLAIRSGRLYWLRGENGVGKSTWLRLVAGLLPSVGKVLWDQSICNAVAKQASFYMPLTDHYEHYESVQSIIKQEYCLRLDQQLTDAELIRLLEYFHLSGCRDRSWGGLSAGQKRVVLQISSLYVRDAVWLLDEPLVHLDERLQQLMYSGMRDHLNQGGAIIATSHRDFSLSYRSLYLCRG